MAAADPRGLWQADDGSRVRIAACGKALCGTMASMPTPIDPATGRPWTDKNNPDPTKMVLWGDQTWEEMMIGWTEFAYDRPVP